MWTAPLCSIRLKNGRAGSWEEKLFVDNGNDRVTVIGNARWGTDLVDGGEVRQDGGANWLQAVGRDRGRRRSRAHNPCFRN